MKRVVYIKKDVSFRTSEATKRRKASLAFEESRDTRKEKGGRERDKAEHEVRWSSKFREVLQIVRRNVQRRRKRKVFADGSRFAGIATIHCERGSIRSHAYV